jgi:hypothetical protein
LGGASSNRPHPRGHAQVVFGEIDHAAVDRIVKALDVEQGAPLVALGWAQLLPHGIAIEILAEMLQRERRIHLRECLAAGARFDQPHAPDPLRHVSARQGRLLGVLRDRGERAHERPPRELAHCPGTQHTVRRRVEGRDRREMRRHLPEEELIDFPGQRTGIERRVLDAPSGHAPARHPDRDRRDQPQG